MKHYTRRQFIKNSLILAGGTEMLSLSGGVPSLAARETTSNDSSVLSDRIQRHDFSVSSKDGLRIFVREMRDAGSQSNRGPLLLVNGGRPGVLASWDVDAPGTSTAEELAKAGHHLYLMDVRGFGRSEFPKEMTKGRFDEPVAVRSNEAVRDIAAVIKEIKRLHPDDTRLAAMGWATGSQWLGHYTSLYPDAITHLIYYNGAYGGPAGGWPLQAEFGDPHSPAALDYQRHGAYRLATAKDLTGQLEKEGSDRTFLKRYVTLCMEGDQTAQHRDPPSFRFPTGPTADTLKLVNGRQIFDASFFRSHVLILRSEKDFWSRPSDAQTLLAHLTDAASAKLVELSGLSHYAHLQPTPDRQNFLDAVLAFTAAMGRS
ncbi:alpha/beta hydrolase fold [Desulfovibrio sp. DV]|uniref:alpha/beta hydrolase n=1 Tax=Desulfovibrio sp. DV TaxID=1844708 RepID=UPI000958F21D|nr:alpha/beta hydrolase [Desulfovibrio sp. DV]OLN30417.1 alpha/beta hydrolase fold [Desulfovibrio sp. DV]